MAVPDEDRSLGHADRRVLCGQRAAVRPVGGHPAPVEQARLGEQEGAGADRDQAVRPVAVRLQPPGEFRVRPARSRSPGHDQQVRLGNMELAQVLVGRAHRPLEVRTARPPMLAVRMS